MRNRDRDNIEGVRVSGRQPKALLLNDGTRLALEEEGPGGRADWTRVGDDSDGQAEVSVSEALDLAGERFDDYVVVRTRAEAEWLELVAEWYREQAQRLRGQLHEATA